VLTDHAEDGEAAAADEEGLVALRIGDSDELQILINCTRELVLARKDVDGVPIASRVQRLPHGGVARDVVPRGLGDVQRPLEVVLRNFASYGLPQNLHLFPQLFELVFLLLRKVVEALLEARA